MSELAERLEMKVPAISNQLQRLADKKILKTRRDGNSICYRIVDPCVTALLDRGRPPDQQVAASEIFFGS